MTIKEVINEVEAFYNASICKLGYFGTRGKMFEIQHDYIVLDNKNVTIVTESDFDSFQSLLSRLKAEDIVNCIDENNYLRIAFKIGKEL